MGLCGGKVRRLMQESRVEGPSETRQAMEGRDLFVANQRRLELWTAKDW